MNLQCSLVARVRQARDLVAQQRYSQAVQLLEETVRRYPRSLRARLALGYTWQQLGQAERAEQTLAEAVRIDPESADAWFRLGCLQGLLERPREAVSSFRRTILLKPDHAGAHYNLGHFLKELGDVAGAADEFRAALRCRPNNELAQQALRDGEEKRTRTGEAPTPHRENSRK
jgi:Tfp pilus assembly protein PilF